MLRAISTRAPHRLPCQRTVSTCARVPSAQPDRQLALPLAFVSLKQSGGSGEWSPWTRLAAQRGYESLVIDLDLDDASAGKSSNLAILEALERELVRILREPGAAPFPPLLFSSSAASVVAEQYVSSHPLSALFIHDPIVPASTSALAKLGLSAPDFDYEPNFPVGLMSQDFDRLKQTRLYRDWYEDDGPIALIRGSQDEAGWDHVTKWMDENGL